MDVLLDAFSRLSDSGVDIFLRIAGKGKLKNELIRQAKELGIDRWVTFLGYLSPGKIREVYAWPGESSLFLTRIFMA